MAIVLRGMTAEETAGLTDAMVRRAAASTCRRSAGPTVGKHSTGGVGDKVSIVLAPAVAACGVVMPKMSGRGLGHTGGTLDKLESIPGFRVALSPEEFVAVLGEVGCAIIGQTADIAPADKALYALRDVTATIESVPLISASVMSKKIAEGSQALVLDVKCGRGAFMKTLDEALALARSLVAIGTAHGVRTEAFVTAHGRAAWAARSATPWRSRSASRCSAAPDLPTCGRWSRRSAPGRCSWADGPCIPTRRSRQVRGVLDDGRARATLRAMVAAQGGDPAVVDDPIAVAAGIATSRWSTRRPTASSPPWTPSGSVARRCCSAPGATGPAIRWITPRASACASAPATGSAAARRSSNSTTTPRRGWPAPARWPPRR